MSTPTTHTAAPAEEPDETPKARAKRMPPSVLVRAQERSGPEYTVAGAAFVKTPSVKDIAEALRDTIDQSGVVAIYGDSGCGKTATLSHLLDRRAATERVVRITFPPKGTHKFQVDYLYQQLSGGIRWPGTASDILMALARLLDEEDFSVIVLDEAQDMNIETLKMVRYLHDTTGGWALALVGGPSYWERLSRYPYLKNRVMRDIAVRPMAPTAFASFAKGLHPLLAGAEEQLLLDVNNRVSQGTIRPFMHFLQTAVLISEQTEQRTLDRDLANATLRRMKLMVKNPGTGHREQAAV